MAITKIQSESLNLADTYDFTGTVTGAGGSNTPAFYAKNQSDQTLVDATVLKLIMNEKILILIVLMTQVIRFTVPTGKVENIFYIVTILMKFLTMYDIQRTQFI